MKSQPVCQSIQRFFKATKAKGFLGPLTGQDFHALLTFVHALNLYASGDIEGRVQALYCLHHAVMSMQEKCRFIAREAIPHVFDWGDRDTMWPKILEPNTEVARLRKEAARWEELIATSGGPVRGCFDSDADCECVYHQKLVRAEGGAQ